MGIQIPEGYELLSGRSRENARAALKLAEERGFPVSSVQTTTEGYFIPTGEDLQVVDAEYVELPEATATKGEFEAFAAEHGIDLSGASNNTQRFEAIQEWAAALPEAETTPVATGDDEKEGE